MPRRAQVANGTAESLAREILDAVELAESMARSIGSNAAAVRGSCLATIQRKCRAVIEQARAEKRAVQTVEADVEGHAEYSGPIPDPSTRQGGSLS